MVEKTLGQIGYEAYRGFTGGKSLVSGQPIPEFEKLSTPIQEAWEKAGQAVAAAVGRAGEIVGYIPEQVAYSAPGEPERAETQIVK